MGKRAWSDGYDLYPTDVVFIALFQAKFNAANREGIKTLNAIRIIGGYNNVSGG